MKGHGMSDAERLAKAVLLFHNPAWITPALRTMWEELTDSKDITTVNLCNLARRILSNATTTV
jgi:hypothetical protein